MTQQAARMEGVANITQVVKPNETSEHQSLMELPEWVARYARRCLLFTFVRLRAKYSKEQLKRRKMDFSSVFQDGLHEVGHNIMESENLISRFGLFKEKETSDPLD